MAARTLTSPTRAVAYLRVSTEEQRNGPEAQRAAITQWATREGVTIAAWCCDQGVSGAAPIDERPALLEALDALRQHRAGVLVVAKRDRLARDVLAAAMIERLATKAPARVISAAGEGTSDDDPASRLLRQMVDAFAEYERAIIRARTKAALGAKRARLERVGAVRFGYALGADGRQLVEHAGEQAIIREVLRLRAAGFTLRGIVAELERAGVVARTGRPLAKTQIVNITRAARCAAA